MEILNTDADEIIHKWEAEEYLIFYRFCFEIMDMAYPEVEFWERPYHIESYDSHIIDVIQQIETHIITTGIILFKYPSYDPLRYYEPIYISELFSHLYYECMNNELFNGIKTIMKGKIQRNLDHLSDYEKLIVLYSKSIVHYGLFYRMKLYGFDFDFEFQKNQLQYNKNYYNKVISDIKANYNNYSDEFKSDNQETPRIIFANEIARKQAIIYFITINTSILEKGLFINSVMFENFLNCLQTGNIEKNQEFVFNDFYKKRLFVKLIDQAMCLFKRYRKNGEYYFLKNTGQYKYKENPITGTNWHGDPLNVEESNSYTRAVQEFNNIKALLPNEVVDRYNALILTA